MLEKEKGVFVAVSDNMKMVPDQIAPWVPGGLTTLGTDGFGRSDTRERLRRFFEVDAESTVIATLLRAGAKRARWNAAWWPRPSRTWAWIRKRLSRSSSSGSVTGLSRIRLVIDRIRMQSNIWT